MKPRILWIDDQIDSLKSLIFFLEKSGYEIKTVTNGQDALHLIEEEYFDIVFLDQFMPGLDGIETLNSIRERSFNLPVIMITKAEDDDIIDSALSEMADDYLIKPVNPKQLQATIKKTLSKKEKIRESVGKNYSHAIGKINDILDNGEDHKAYKKIHHIFNLWNLAINRNIENDIISMHNMQKEQINSQFFTYIKNHYTELIQSKEIVMSHTFLDNFIIPELRENRKVLFVLIDCMRYDHYLLMETFLKDYFKTQLSYYYAILPTATPYARNAIFSGLLPSQIHSIYPDKWTFMDKESQNQHENFFLRKKILTELPKKNISYSKISTNEDLSRYIGNFNNIINSDLNALIINIMDVFTHFRSDSDILKDMLPDENSLLAFISTWFRTSGILQFLNRAADLGFKIIITSDHGSIISKKAMKIETGKDVSVNLKYKFGSSIRSEDKNILTIDNPLVFGLPVAKKTDKWYIASGNGYLVYSTKFNQYKNKYFNTFQHGGVSMEEMIMPVGILDKRV